MIRAESELAAMLARATPGEQARMLLELLGRLAAEQEGTPVVVRDDAGRVCGYYHPLRHPVPGAPAPETPEFLAEMRRRAVSPGAEVPADATFRSLRREGHNGMTES
jgi:hypothetical protein